MFVEDYASHWDRPTFLEARYLIHPAIGKDFQETGRTFFDTHVASVLRGGDVVLDLGCGVGRITKEVLGRASWVYAADVSQQMLHFAAGYCREHADKLGTVLIRDETLPLESSSVDLVIWHEVLHFLHPADAQSHLKEIARLLKPGGRLVLSFLNSDQPCEDPRFNFPERRVGTAFIKDYSLASVLGLLRHAELEVEKVEIAAITVITAGLRKRVVPGGETPSRGLLPLYCYIDDETGYGQLGSEFACEVLRTHPEVQLALKPIQENLKSGHPYVELNAHPRAAELPGRWLLLIDTLVIGARDIVLEKESVLYTMWESTRITPAALRRLKSAAMIMVPNAWFASCISAYGVDTPVKVVPMGLRLADFPRAPQNFKQPFTIGTAARFEGGGIRKGLNTVMDAFALAFPTEQNVRLKIKSSPSCPIPGFDDPRISVETRLLSTPELSAWYKSINVLASGSSCEGWGRHQHEAMCTGRPVIGVNFGGVTEFWNPSNGYAVDFQLGPGRGVYAGLGSYPYLSVESMADQMRRAYSNRDELKRKSQLAYEAGAPFTTARFAAALLRELRAAGFLA